MSTLSERLQQALRRSGISQAELARRCGVKQPSVHGWLSGKAKFLRGENLLKAASVLGVSEDWLATGRGAMDTPPAHRAPAQGPSARQPMTPDELAERLAATLKAVPAGLRPAAAKLLESLASTPDDEALKESLAHVLGSSGSKERKRK